MPPGDGVPEGLGGLGEDAVDERGEVRRLDEEDGGRGDGEGGAGGHQVVEVALWRRGWKRSVQMSTRFV